MAFDFPANPVMDQTYTFGTTTYTWRGYAWMIGASGSGGGGGGTVPPITVGNDGEALVALTGVATWGAPINSGSF